MNQENRTIRPRRLRRTEGIRSIVRETSLTPQDLIFPLFVVPGEGVRKPIVSMPGIFQCSPDEAARDAMHARESGIPAVLLFGIPRRKDSEGTESCVPDGVVQEGVRAIRQAVPDLVVITDVCMCEYTDHGHCGILDDNGTVDNDATLEHLRRIAVSHAEAGADFVAPSGMIDGMVAAIRSALDLAGYTATGVLSYAVKYASAFYGPFREAAEGAPKFGDRRTHQMNPANVREAVREARLDEQEGADMLMVKPALAYLDVVRAVRNAVPELPLVAYNVSGEYSMVKAAAAQGWIDEKPAILEMLLGMKRAGADIIITYFAPEVARWLTER